MELATALRCSPLLLPQSLLPCMGGPLRVPERRLLMQQLQLELWWALLLVAACIRFGCQPAAACAAAARAQPLQLSCSCLAGSIQIWVTAPLPVVK